MIVKIYALFWALIGASAALIFAGGYFTTLTGVVYGFICFGMTFMGMLAVLPSIFHNEHHQIATPIKSIKLSPENHQSHTAVQAAPIEAAVLVAKTA